MGRITLVSMTLEVWHILSAVTVVVWFTFCMWPRKASRGYAAITDAFTMAFQSALLLIVTLLGWLIYFAVT